MSKIYSIRSFSPTPIHLEFAGGRHTRLVDSMEELGLAVAEAMPHRLEVPRLVSTAESQDAVLRADWQWRTRLQIALRSAGMSVTNSYLSPRLGQFSLLLECKPIDEVE